MKTKAEQKKIEYWDYFLKLKKFHSYGFTKNRLEKAKIILWEDKDFWWDILRRHSGMENTPDEMKINSPELFGHCFGNMNGMITQVLVERGILK